MTELRKRANGCSSNGSCKDDTTENGSSKMNSDKNRGKSTREDKTLYVLPASSVAWLLVGLAIGTCFAGPWGGDLHNLVLGYRWDFRQRCIQEAAEPNGYGVDICRLPVDCKICSDVSEIDEVHVMDLSVELFEEKYAFTSRPIVIRNATLHWNAMGILSYDWLKEIIMRPRSEEEEKAMMEHEENCWFNNYKTKELRNVAAGFKLSEDRVRMRPGFKPWYFGFQVCDPVLANRLHELYERPTFINPDSTPPKKPWLFVGTPGPGAHIHIDNVHLPSWQAQITGVKKWYVQAPPECSWECGRKIMETTVYPGDIIVINTNEWFHGTEILPTEDLSLVITNEFD